LFLGRGIKAALDRNSTPVWMNLLQSTVETVFCKYFTCILSEREMALKRQFSMLSIVNLRTFLWINAREQAGKLH